MTMDYFLLLCSLLLPVVSAVEGKKIPSSLVVAMPEAYSPSYPASQHLLHLRGLGAAAGEAPVHPDSFICCHPRVKTDVFHLQSGHLPSF